MTLQTGPMPGRLLSGALMAGVLAIDAVTPLGVNVPILYLVPLLLTFLTDTVRTRTLLAIVASVLTVLSATWDWKWSDAWVHGAINRGFDLGVFWVALGLSIRDARTTRELRDLRTALESSVILSITDVKGVIRHVNDRFCAISKYSRDELIGRSHRTVNSGAHSHAFMREMWATITAGRIWHGALLNRAKDGAAYWVDSTIVPFVDGSGRPYRYLAIEHDISEQKQAEARIRSQAALARIGEMAAIVAHEVRNPVAGVRAGLQLFERLPSLSTDERLIVRQMMERLDLLNAHVSALVHFARPRAPAIRKVAIGSLLNEIARSIRDTDVGSRVQFEIQGLEAPVLGDVAMLHEIFSQLLLNAVEAQSGAGTIVVTVTETGNTVDVRITDRGPGIPMPLRERIFEPLFTTKPKGVGLGLAIAKQLVELHGGEIAVVQGSSSGTTISVCLQRAVDQGQPAKRLEHPGLSDF